METQKNSTYYFHISGDSFTQLPSLNFTSPISGTLMHTCICIKLDSQSLTNTTKSNWTHSRNSFTHRFSPATHDKFYHTTAMARLFSYYTSDILFLLLCLAACILATSAPTAQVVHVCQATTSVIQLNSGVCYTDSYCRP